MAEVKPWLCAHEGCSKSFKRKGDLTRHAEIHIGEGQHKCTACGKKFRQRSGFNTHQNTHTRAKPYACGVGQCHKTFGDPSSCTRHRNELHGNGVQYKCRINGCTTRIKRKAAFAKHLRDKHHVLLRASELGPFETLPTSIDEAQATLAPTQEYPSGIMPAGGAGNFFDITGPSGTGDGGLIVPVNIQPLVYHHGPRRVDALTDFLPSSTLPQSSPIPWFGSEFTTHESCFRPQDAMIDFDVHSYLLPYAGGSSWARGFSPSHPILSAAN